MNKYTEVRYPTSPEDIQYYNTEKLRNKFLVESLFVADKQRIVYTH